MYVLPYGQMSLWGQSKLAPNAYYFFYYLFSIKKECLEITINDLNLALLSTLSNNSSFALADNVTKLNRIKALQRIGPHNIIIYNIIYGTLLGFGHAERRIKGNGARINFYQEGSHSTYLLWLHRLINDLGYCSSQIPSTQTRLGKKGIVIKIIRFKTWTYSSFNWIYEQWYINGVKIVPSNIGEYLNPLALSIWIMDDGCKMGSGLKLATNSFSYSDCLKLVKVLNDNFNLKASVQKADIENQFVIYIWKDSMPLLREIVKPYVHSSMKYKIAN